MKINNKVGVLLTTLLRSPPFVHSPLMFSLHSTLSFSGYFLKGCFQFGCFSFNNSASLNDASQHSYMVPPELGSGNVDSTQPYSDRLDTTTSSTTCDVDSVNDTSKHSHKVPTQLGSGKINSTQPYPNKLDSTGSSNTCDVGSFSSNDSSQHYHIVPPQLGLGNADSTQSHPDKLDSSRSSCDVDSVYKIVMDNKGCGDKLENALELAKIPLTTHLVFETLNRLRFEEKLAFRFFMWAARQENYEHECHVYNEMIDILSSTKFKVRQFGIVCDVLDYMKRNGKKTVPIDVLLNILRKFTEKHLTQILKCSKKKKRFRVKRQPEVAAFNLLLDAICKCCLVEDAEIMFNKLKSKVTPDASTFNILFFGWCRVRNPVRAMMILEEMSSLGFVPDSFTYNAALETFCKEGMVNKALDLFKLMKMSASASSPPTAKTYVIIILALVKNDRVDDCFEVVSDMIQRGCLPDVSTYKELIEGMCLAGKVEEAYWFLDEMAKRGYPSDIVTYNCFLKVLCENKKADEAMRLYWRMVDLDCMPSVHTFNMLIEMFFSMGNSEGAHESWDEMDKIGCERDVTTYCVMIEGLFGCDENEKACYLLNDIVSKGIQLPYSKFDLFLRHLSVIGDLRTIHNLSEHMKRFYNPAMARHFALSQKRKGMRLRQN